MAKVSKNSLTAAERNQILKALRNEGIAPPKVGYCVRAFGGEICRHPKYSNSASDTGYQAIEIDEDKVHYALVSRGVTYFNPETGKHQKTRRGLYPSGRRYGSSESKPSLSKFVRSYLETALWSSTDESDESGGEPLDKNYSISDISDKSIKQAIKDCESFQEHFADQLAEAGTSEQNGHDFWLTRNRHGAGFWDRGYPKEIGDVLTEGAHGYGEVNPIVGDDGEIHLE